MHSGGVAIPRLAAGSVVVSGEPPWMASASWGSGSGDPSDPSRLGGLVPRSSLLVGLCSFLFCWK